MSRLKTDPDAVLRMKRRGMTNVDIAAKLGVDESSVRRVLRKVAYNPHHMSLALMEEIAAQLDKPLEHDVATQGGVAVTADWHHPLTDYALVNQLLDHAHDLGIRSLVVAGDWWNLDELSQFESKQESAKFVRELGVGAEAMERAADVFDRIYFTWGNHDNRFTKLLQYTLDFKRSMRMLFDELAPAVVDKVVFSNLDHMSIHTPAGDYRVSHPKSYSRVPLYNPRNQASKFLTHALSGHTHHFALGYDVSGRFIAAELGGLHRKDVVQYLQRTTNYPAWNQGYALIDSHGWLHMEGEGVSFSALAAAA